MTSLNETPDYTPGIYQLELTDPVVGGPEGISNRQAKELANRTAYLKQRTDALEAGTTPAGKATQLATARNIAISGDASGSAAFNGTANIAISIALANSGIGAGTYRSVTVDAKGRVTGGSNPNTLGGYGITDAQPLDANLSALAAINAVGFYVSSGAGTALVRSLASGTGISINYPDGASGNPVITNTGVTSVTGTANQVLVSASIGGVVFSLPQSIHAGATVNFNQVLLGSDPLSAMHAVTKQYVDNLASGIHVKDSVLVATTANITLSGTQTIDGVAVTAGARVLVKNQTIPAQNGIYSVAAGTWTRASDADVWEELVSVFVFVERGTINADTGWVCTADQGGTLGTTAVSWTQFAGAGVITGANGIVVNGNQVSLATSGVIAGTYAKVTVDPYGRVTNGGALVAGDIPSLPWSIITSGKPSTLTGYGIAVPTQAEAEAGTDNTLPMTALRALQLIRSATVTATELLRGVLRVGTQAEVEAGSQDDVAVTPKKLRWGFGISAGTTGFVIFPTWLGSLIIQWGKTSAVTADSGLDVVFPLAFPAAAYALSCVIEVQNDVDGNVTNYRNLTKTGFRVTLGYRDTGNNNLGASWIAIGK
ncbi:hypothetical protein QYE80_15695 [Pseudomonas tohonis]|nr:hypothetical protein [Pseudomonas tohonis]